MFQRFLKKEVPTRVEASFAREALTADQAALAEDIEHTFDALDARVQALARRLRELSPAEVVRETTSIREAHDGLRRIVRRFQASLKSTSELERELAGWQEHPTQGELHADHPVVRAEIARSELSVRRPEKLAQEQPKKQMPVTSIKVPVETSQGPLEVQVHEVSPRLIPDEKHLLAAIREATREAERWHGHTTDCHGQEAFDQVHLVRDLHAILKRLDRQNGVRRDRIRIAIDPREWHFPSSS